MSRPVPFASHLPERAQRWQPPLAPEPTSQGELAFHHRPLKLLDKAEQIAVLYATPDGYPQRFRWRGGVHDVVRVEGPNASRPSGGANAARRGCAITTGSRTRAAAATGSTARA